MGYLCADDCVGMTVDRYACRELRQVAVVESTYTILFGAGMKDRIKQHDYGYDIVKVRYVNRKCR